jgi:hypothetical protein
VSVVLLVDEVGGFAGVGCASDCTDVLSSLELVVVRLSPAQPAKVKTDPVKTQRIIVFINGSCLRRHRRN